MTGERPRDDFMAAFGDEPMVLPDGQVVHSDRTDWGRILGAVQALYDVLKRVGLASGKRVTLSREGSWDDVVVAYDSETGWFSWTSTTHATTDVVRRSAGGSGFSSGGSVA